jgi:outer membrane protein OmpA-like peptidoglycan-associated protein
METAMKRICLAVVVFALAGCQTQQQGAVLTPVAPAVSPQQPAPPIAAAVSAGPLTRAAVETYMDAQESDLRSYLRGQGVLVARRGDGLLVNIPNDKLFDKMELTAWGNAVITSVSQVFAHYDHSAVEVDAYTDSTGTDQENLSLSQKRAKIVSDALAQKGVAPARLTASGLGATNPKVTDTRDPRNRRIELKITPTPSG